LDISEECSTKQEAIELVQRIRDTIEKETGCTASSGISTNMLLARLATSKAKPNGQFFLDPENVYNVMC